MIVPYVVEDSSRAYRRYYENQVGHGLGVFRGSPMQRGAGIRSFLSGVGKTLIPLAKSAGKELLSSGLNVASDMLKGKDFKSSAESNFKAAGSNLLDAIGGGLRGSKRIQKRPKAKTRSSKKKKTNDGFFKHVAVN